MAKNPEGTNPATERETAPATATTPQIVMPRQKRVERSGAATSPYSRRYPQVRGGICEFCGVIDGNYPSEYQYKLCPHYRGMQLVCSYCPPSKDADDVLNHSTVNIADHPNNPDELVVWCDSYECSKKHLERFRVSNS